MSKFSLYKEWEMFRNNFMHYAIRSMYDFGDGYRNIVTQEERNYCKEMANYYYKQINILRNKIEEIN